MDSENLDIEWGTYQAHKAELLTTAPGQWVVIKGRDVAGTFLTYEAALKHGYGRFGVTDLMVHRIVDPEPVHYMANLAPDGVGGLTLAPWARSGGSEPGRPVSPCCLAPTVERGAGLTCTACRMKIEGCCDGGDMGAAGRPGP